jgi:hypothetical protein
MKSYLGFYLLLVLCLAATSQGQPRCGSEVKLLLPPDELPSALTKLNAKKETAGKVYLFDTNKSELLSQGAIVRLRLGSRADLMVKVRMPAAKEITFDRGDDGRYKCEVDVTTEGAVRSYSIQTTFAGALPASGTELVGLLSPAQKKLLQEANVAIDWRQVRRVADIQSRSWRVPGQPTFSKLTLELWQWPTGAALDISTKLAGDDQSSGLTQLQQFVTSKGLVLSSAQKMKTTLVLEKSASGEAPRHADGN